MSSANWQSFNGIITHDVQSLSRGTKNVLAATYFGIAGAKRNYQGQIRNIVATGKAMVGARPCLIGECGIPMDINEKQAFETGDYAQHNDFLDAVIGAMEENLVHFTLWNYNPGNDNKWGDYWNGEDFSIYSPQNSPKKRASRSSQSKLRTEVSRRSISSDTDRPPVTPSTPFEITELYFLEGEKSHHHHEGGRVLDAIVRPYAAKVAGTPIAARFERQKLEYNFEMVTVSSKDAAIDAASYKRFLTEIYVPNYHFGNVARPDISVSDGEWIYSKEKQTIYWLYDPEYTGEGGLGAAMDRYVTHVVHRGEVKHWIRIKHPSPPAYDKRWYESLWDFVSLYFEDNYG